MKYELERTQKNTFLGKKNKCRIQFTSVHPASSNVCMHSAWCLYGCTCICDLIHDCMLMDGDVCSVSRVRSLPSLPSLPYSDPIGTY